jgi:hypothetical protein
MAHPKMKATLLVWLVTTAVLTVSLLATSSAAHASAGAAWAIDQGSEPTNFAPGVNAVPPGAGAGESEPKYNLTITNVGAATVEGVVVTDVLPARLSPAPSTPPEWRYSRMTTNGGSPVPCETAGQTVTCVIKGPIHAGARIDVYIAVDVESGPEGAVENRVTVSAPHTPTAVQVVSTKLTAESPQFSFLPGTHGLSGAAFDERGEPPVAGSHPYSVDLTANLPAIEEGYPEDPFEELKPLEAPRSIGFELPAGMVVNPQATSERCTHFELNNVSEGCPVATQVGRAFFDVLSGIPSGSEPLYNMVPDPGSPAEVAFVIEGVAFYARSGLNGTFHLTAESSELLSKFAVPGVSIELWGVPSETSHDAFRQSDRVTCEEDGVCQKHCESVPCSVDPSPHAFLTMPSACSDDMMVGAHATGWLGSTAREERPFTTRDGETEHVEGCGNLHFEPSVSIAPDSRAANSPAGLDVKIKTPQNEGPYGLEPATLKRVSLQLPAGMAVSPSAADGLGACSQAGIGIGNNSPASCPASSKIATAEITTPLLQAPLKGSVYLAEQSNNPFGTLVALYLVVEGEGVVIKVPGRVDLDPSTGQLTATFDNNPQLPFDELNVQFDSGPRAPLVTPPTCGTYTTRTEMTSWASSTPVVLDTPMTIDEGCATGAFSPQVESGTTNPVAAAFSPFTLRVTRTDAEQNISRITATLPDGLVAKLAGVPLCGDAEATTGACPAASEVGTTTVGVGAGTEPLYLPELGKAPTAVYLAGPYENAPFSLVVDVPAQAGPFNLGTIAVRVALDIDPSTAQVTAVSDPLPQILQGIPIDYRDLRVEISRPGFVLNPTSCEPMPLTSALTSASGTTATSSDRFQVAGCASLGFKPTLTAATQAKTSKSNGASLAIKIAQKGGEANIHKVMLEIPKSLPVRLTTLQKACTEAQFNSNPGGCPEGSYIGSAVAHTPLLASPLTGPAILVSHGGAAFPDVEFLLSGENVHVTLDGKTNIKGGVTYSHFESVPDVPITSFETTLPEGPHSIFSANGDLCNQALTIPTTIVGQNGAELTQTTKVGVTACGKATISLVKAKVSRGTVAVTFATNRTGTVTFTGPGLKSAKHSYSAGRHTIKLVLNASGNAAYRKHTKIKIKLALKGTSGTATHTSNLRA